MRFRQLNHLGDISSEENAFLDKFVEGIEVMANRMYSGKPFGSHFPKDARIALQPESKGIRLRSFLGNTDKMLAVTREVSSVIERFCPGQAMEYLPFNLHDHRNRLLSSEYVIVHPLGTFDCLDLKASNIEWSTRKADTVIRIHKRVLDRAKTKDAPALFRLHHEAHRYVFRSDLAEAIDALKPTNILWEPLLFSDEAR